MIGAQVPVSLHVPLVHKAKGEPVKPVLQVYEQVEPDKIVPVQVAAPFATVGTDEAEQAIAQLPPLTPLHTEFEQVTLGVPEMV